MSRKEISILVKVSRDYRIHFWGVRGSIPSGPSRFGSNTSCVEVQLDHEKSLFCDAGTGIREATEKRNFKEIIVYLSHFHWDHIQGFPFVSALGNKKTKVKILSAFPDVKERFHHLFDQRFHPVSLTEYEDQIKFITMDANQATSLEGLKLEIALLNHPGDSYALKISGNHQSFVYATDSDYDPVAEKASELFKEADWMVCDSQYLIGDHLAKAHFGHSSFKTAIDVCASHRVKNCLLYHYDPSYSDQQLEELEKQAQNYSLEKYSLGGPKVLMAREGLQINIPF